jgi:hypothetical protein
LHVARKVWRGHNRNAPCWVFIVLMMGKILKGKVFKSLDASFVTTIFVNALNPKLKKENV